MSLSAHQGRDLIPDPTPVSLSLSCTYSTSCQVPLSCLFKAKSLESVLEIEHLDYEAMVISMYSPAPGLLSTVCWSGVQLHAYMQNALWAITY